MPTEPYDYIIVGAGSAGCVMAYRLSANPASRVLLLEAGGENNSALIDMPMGIGRTLTDPALCWYYSTEPEKRDGAQGYAWLRGKGLGGSSSVNGMVYFHGQPEDYDGWVKDHGCVGWGWNEMLRCFREIEDHQLGEGPWRGSGGPLRVSVDRLRSPLTEAVIAAGEGLGLTRKTDLNEPQQEGIGYSPATIWRGRRVSAARAFLEPARRRPNLEVVTGASVERLLIEQGIVSGVMTAGGRCYMAREVILAAGTLQSPVILQQSGIGDARLLSSLGIDVVADRREVGRNLLEHKSLSMNVALTTNHSHNLRLQGPALAWSALRYGLGFGGPLTSTFEVTAFLKTRPELVQPDAQVLMWGVTTDYASAKIKLESHSAMLLVGYPMRPQSPGTLQIASASPSARPRITTNFLAVEADRAATVGVFRFMRALLQEPALGPLIKSETRPGSDVETDDEIIDFCLRSPTCLHAVGTCRMGGDAESVVDPQLRVRGVSGLRVIDGSILPTQVSGNTNGPIIAAAWRAADIILEQ